MRRSCLILMCDIFDRTCCSQFLLDFFFIKLEWTHKTCVIGFRKRKRNSFYCIEIWFPIYIHKLYLFFKPQFSSFSNSCFSLKPGFCFAMRVFFLIYYTFFFIHFDFVLFNYDKAKFSLKRNICFSKSGFQLLLFHYLYIFNGTTTTVYILLLLFH